MINSVTSWHVFWKLTSNIIYRMEHFCGTRRTILGESENKDSSHHLFLSKLVHIVILYKILCQGKLSPSSHKENRPLLG